MSNKIIIVAQFQLSKQTKVERGNKQKINNNNNID